MKSVCLAACAVAALTLSAPSSVQAQDVMPAILADALAQSAVASDVAHWQFTVNFSSEDGDLVARFDGARPEDQRWTLVSPAADAMNEMQAEVWSDLITDDEDESDGLFFHVSDADFDWETASLEAENSSSVIFSFQPDAEQADDEDLAFLEHIRGEMTIDRTDAEVSRIRIYAPESFKPHFAVRVREFEMVQTYSRVDGIPRPVLTRMSQNVRASAMMQTVEESFSIEFSDIRYSGG